MKEYTSDHIKNIALLGHAGCGKTTLAETMLFEAGKISRKGTIEDKNTVSDYHEIEHERGNSISSTLMHLEWREDKINMLDTPGMDDFVGDVISALRVADTGVMVLNAQFGVEIGTEIAWEHAEKMKTPLLFVVNQLDDEKADFEKTVESARGTFGRKITVVQYPLNQGAGFNSIIDVLKMTMYKFGAEGGKPEKVDIPEDQKAKADQLHNDLVEAVAENDESLMELFFEKGTLDEDHMREGLKLAMIKQEIFPLFCVSAKQNMGSGRILGFIGNVCPSASEMPGQSYGEGDDTLACDPAGDPALFIFKTISEPHLGDMSFFKVYSGKVSTGLDLYNPTSSESERISALYAMDGKNREALEVMNAGDIGATVKLKKTHTNDTLSPKDKSYELAPIDFPGPSIRTAVETKAKGDEEKLSVALHQMREEDPTIVVEHSHELKQLIIHGQGELHLNMIKWRLDNIYHIGVEYVEPKIPYRETIHKSAKAQYKHKKQSGGAGQFAEIYILIEPYTEGMPDPPDLNVRNRETIDLKWGGKLEFMNCIVGGAIDNKYMNAIQKGIMEKLQDAPLTGGYARDIRVSVYDGKMHPVDSNDMAFKLASIHAFKQAFMDADPKILEPIYDIEVFVPEEMMGDVMSDLQTRRAVIQGMDAKGNSQVIKAKVPLAELYKYSSALRSLSQGRAKHTRIFAEYELVPGNIQQQVIKEHSKEDLAEV